MDDPPIEMCALTVAKWTVSADRPSTLHPKARTRLRHGRGLEALSERLAFGQTVSD
jgi:hypothetical protein